MGSAQGRPGTDKKSEATGRLSFYSKQELHKMLKQIFKSLDNVHDICADGVLFDFLDKYCRNELYGGSGLPQSTGWTGPASKAYAASVVSGLRYADKDVNFTLKFGDLLVDHLLLTYFHEKDHVQALSRSLNSPYLIRRLLHERTGHNGRQCIEKMTFRDQRIMQQTLCHPKVLEDSEQLTEADIAAFDLFEDEAPAAKKARKA